MTAFKDIDINGILPQQPPFRFVRVLESYTPEETVVSFVVGDCLLIEDGHLCAAGVIEHMAQACAVRVGYISKYILNLPVKIGFLGQVRKYKLMRLPKVGERLETHVRLLQEVFNITLCEVEVKVDGEVIARATLKNAIKDD